MEGKWTRSGATEHCKICHGIFNWMHPKTLAIIPEYRKRKIREALEINKARTKSELKTGYKVLNRDDGDSVTTKSWKPFFNKLADVNTLH